MDFIRRQAPARAAVLLATTMLLACTGNPATTEPDTAGGGTKKVSKNASAAPKPGASSSTAAGGNNGGGVVTASPSAGASSNPNGTTSTAPGTSPTPSTATSTAPTTSTAPSTATSVAPSAAASSDGSTASTAPLTQAATPAPAAIVVSSLAGDGTSGFENGAAASASFNSPRGLAVHPTNGDVYVADTLNHAIRKISNGQVTTMIGTGDATTPQDVKTLSAPQGVAVMNDGTLLIADTANNRIRKLRATEAAKELTARELDFVVGGLSAGFADGATDTARLTGPTGIALTADQQFLWVVDTGNNCIRLVNLANDSIETVAGSTEAGDATATSTGTQARFRNPTGCVAVGNNTLFVADSQNGKIRKIVKDGNAVTVTTVDAGTFVYPSDVIAAGTDPETNGSLLVADGSQLSISRFAAGAVEFYVNPNERGYAEGAVASARFEDFADMVLHPNGSILIADYTNHRIRKLAQ